MIYSAAARPTQLNLPRDSLHALGKNQVKERGAGRRAGKACSAITFSRPICIEQDAGFRSRSFQVSLNPTATLSLSPAQSAAGLSRVVSDNLVVHWRLRYNEHSALVQPESCTESVRILSVHRHAQIPFCSSYRVARVSREFWLPSGKRSYLD